MRYREFKPQNEDLVEPQEKERPVSKPMNLNKLGNWAEKDEFTGGVYARGTPDPKDPHMFRKKSKMPSKLDFDAYYQYVKYIKPYVDSNPFFPRVYEIILKKDPEGNVKPDYRVEKLMSLDDAEDKTGTNLSKFFTQKYFGGKFPEGVDSAVEAIQAAFTKDQYFDLITDKKLKQAITIIKQFLNTNFSLMGYNDFKLDVHRGNMMIRFGPGGPQLVFTDPVHDSGESIVGYNSYHGEWPVENPFKFEPWDPLEKK